MNEKTGEMMPAGSQPEHLTVQHMGHPRQGMPVAGMGGGKGPCDGIGRYAVLHMRVVIYVIIVVIINKIKFLHLPINRRRNKD